MNAPRIKIKNAPLVYLLILIPLAAAGIAYPLVAGKLPEQVATHWSGANPDGFSDTATFVPVCLGLIILGVSTSLISLAQRTKPALLLMLLFIGGMLSWTAAAIFITSTVATALAQKPEDAQLGALLFVLMAMSVLGLAPLWVSGVYQQYSKKFNEDRQARIAAAQGIQPPAPQQPELAGEFSQRMAAPLWLWALSLGMLALFVLVGILPLLGIGAEEDASIATIISLVLVAGTMPLLLGLCLIRVTVTDEHFRVSSAIFGFPFKTIKFDQIQAVTSDTIEPMMWGGWGWRIIPGGSAVVLKRHEGLVFDLQGNKRFAVTIPESRQAAALLNSRMAPSN